MSRKKTVEAWPRSIRFEGASVRVAKRSNGMFALRWREDGTWKTTTRSSEAEALDWAGQKARTLARTLGSRWVRPGEAEAIATLRQLAGGDAEDLGHLVGDVRSALGILDGRATLAEAAQLFQRLAPPAASRDLLLADAVEEFLAEYRAHHPRTTLRSLQQPLRALVAHHPGLMLIDVEPSHIETYARLRADSPRTVRNRIAAWRRFFHRAVELGWWPESRKNPAALVKRPRLPDKAPEILTPAQGAFLLQLIEQQQPQHLSHLLIGGWLGCRPSELQRLAWTDFDWEHAMLHVRAEVARKKIQERWVPLRPGLVERLRALSERFPGARACRWRAREFISLAAREAGIVDHWPADGLRHSYITYRLREIDSIDRTAEEAGNSPAEIRASYRRPIPPGMAAAWFALVS